LLRFARNDFGVLMFFTDYEISAVNLDVSRPRREGRSK
jgi:hypothetical protein